MFKIYTNKNEFKEKYNKTLSHNLPSINNEFTQENYMISFEKLNDYVICYKGYCDDNINIIGSSNLIEEITKEIIYLGLTFSKVKISSNNASIFISTYVNIMGGDFQIYEINNEYISYIYNKKNIESCILAGGCFWCMSKPYYEYDGIRLVLSGYSGGEEILPKYEEVKGQKTTHKECVKLIYDNSIISYKAILDIYFDTIDPFDDGGQFIDRGLSYTCALYYQDENMKKNIEDYIFNLERKFERKITVKVLPEKVFYMAEEYHQDFAIKNPEDMEKELIESGRKKGKIYE